MHLQTLIVAALVAGCGAYVLWTLLPRPARRTLAAQLLRLPLPAAVARPLERAGQASAGCGCDGCGRDVVGKPSRAVVTVHRRR